MSMSVPFFVSNLSDSQTEQVLSDIRSSDYIKEICSGETSPQDSGLWNLVLPFRSSNITAKRDDDVQTFIAETKDLDQSKWYKNCLIVADERTMKDGDGSLIVIQLDSKGEQKDVMRVARGSILEIVGTSESKHVAWGWRLGWRVCLRQSEPKSLTACIPVSTPSVRTFQKPTWNWMISGICAEVQRSLIAANELNATTRLTSDLNDKLFDYAFFSAAPRKAGRLP